MQAGTATTTVKEDSPRGAKKSQVAQKDKFFWAYTEEPHRTRRQAIIQAHPEASSCKASCSEASTDVCIGPEAMWIRIID